MVGDASSMDASTAPPRIQRHERETPRTVPWFMIGAPERAHTFALLLHGLGQRAARVAEQLAPAAAPGVCLVVPEALSRALPHPGAERAGASWSTGEDAEADLVDNMRYLDGLADELLTRTPEGARRLLLGFSQGGMTVARWLARRPRAWDRVVLWGSAIPDDVDPMRLRAGLGETELVVAIGDDDRFVTPERLERARGALDALHPGWRAHHHAGGHEMSAEVLAELLEAGR